MVQNMDHPWYILRINAKCGYILEKCGVSAHCYTTFVEASFHILNLLFFLNNKLDLLRYLPSPH